MKSETGRLLCRNDSSAEGARGGDGSACGVCEEGSDKRLYERLRDYASSGSYPFHMPGHKRRALSPEIAEICRMDITEIDGFDNLHDARGILRQAQQFTAKLYQSGETYFSVNGSTGAILAAISAAVPPGGKILIARNCHRAVYHAIEINRLEVVYIYPQVCARYTVNEGIYPQDIDKKWINHPDIHAIVITSPTYDGVVSDIRRICDSAHEKGIPVIVDEAHGAHFPFSEYFPESALHCGADIVIQSVHKTLPAMTQTAVLHVNGGLINRERLRHMLTVYQTSSPSYILMGSIDDCMHLLAERGEELFARYTKSLDELRRSLGACRRIRLMEKKDLNPACSYDYDRSKLVLSAGPGTGRILYRKLLDTYGLQMEMTSSDYVLAMTSVCDDEEGFARLREAILELDAGIGSAAEPAPERVRPGGGIPEPAPEKVLPAWEALLQEKESVPLWEAEGTVSAEYVYLYPPGIPLLVPGERISEAVLVRLREWQDAGMEISGISGSDKETGKAGGDAKEAGQDGAGIAVVKGLRRTQSRFTAGSRQAQ